MVSSSQTSSSRGASILATLVLRTLSNAWLPTSKGLARVFSFANEQAASDFIDEVRADARQYDHDPTISVAHGTEVRLTYITHSVNAVTRKDREAARRVGDIAEGFHALGGPGSGNFGHSGRPGEVGGSSSEGSLAAPPKPVSTEQAQQIHAYKAQGMGNAAIAKRMGWHYSESKRVQRVLDTTNVDGTPRTGRIEEPKREPQPEPQPQPGIQPLAALLPGDSRLDERALAHMGSQVRTVFTPPPPTAALLEKAHIKVVLTSGRITDEREFAHDKGQTPRGWTSGYTWDDVAGAYNSASGTIVASSQMGLRGYSGGSVVGHETGHGLDFALGKTLKYDWLDTNLRASWDKNVKDNYNVQPYYRQTSQSYTRHFDRKAPAGLEESFAESFSIWKHRGTEALAREFSREWADDFVKAIEHIPTSKRAHA